MIMKRKLMNYNLITKEVYSNLKLVTNNNQMKLIRKIIKTFKKFKVIIKT